jgi:lactoylglutathione lyase
VRSTERPGKPHPKGNEDAPIGGAGVLIELVDAPDEVVKAFDTIAEASE